jgi:hypothetical protein
MFSLFVLSFLSRLPVASDGYLGFPVTTQQRLIWNLLSEECETTFLKNGVKREIATVSVLNMDRRLFNDDVCTVERWEDGCVQRTAGVGGSDRGLTISWRDWGKSRQNCWCSTWSSKHWKISEDSRLATGLNTVRPKWKSTEPAA